MYHFLPITHTGYQQFVPGVQTLQSMPGEGCQYARWQRSYF